MPGIYSAKNLISAYCAMSSLFLACVFLINDMISHMWKKFWWLIFYMYWETCRAVGCRLKGYWWVPGPGGGITLVSERLGKWISNSGHYLCWQLDYIHLNMFTCVSNKVLHNSQAVVLYTVSWGLLTPLLSVCLASVGSVTEFKQNL